MFLSTPLDVFWIEAYLAAIVVVALHLHALAEIHERLVDFASFGQRCSSRLRIASSFGT
jgi:hypothetical protein